MTAFFGLFLISLPLALSGCVVHKVAGTDSLDSKVQTLGEHLSNNPESVLVVTQLNTYPEGAHCFEPLLYVLSLGVIPTHCESRYHVSNASTELLDLAELETDVVVTSMQGWLTGFLAVLPGWQLGYGERIDDDVRLLLQTSGVDSKTQISVRLQYPRLYSPD